MYFPNNRDSREKVIALKKKKRLVLLETAFQQLWRQVLKHVCGISSQRRRLVPGLQVVGKKWHASENAAVLLSPSAAGAWQELEVTSHGFSCLCGKHAKAKARSKCNLLLLAFIIIIIISS